MSRRTKNVPKRSSYNLSQLTPPETDLQITARLTSDAQSRGYTEGGEMGFRYGTILGFAAGAFAGALGCYIILTAGPKAAIDLLTNLVSKIIGNAFGL
jgi:hypothetical protein